jgi:hypothetical protein
VDFARTACMKAHLVWLWESTHDPGAAAADESERIFDESFADREASRQDAPRSEEAFI